VAFFPEDKPFQVLTKAVAASLRTYELFEIAHLILEKNDRFLVGCRPFNHGTNKDARIYQSVPDQIPFLSEAEAIAHVMHKHLERFFTVETVEIDPPKGNFLMVSKCGITGEVLGPPNYHGYQQALREHHAARLSRMPFDRFTSRIESVRDQALVDQWMARMKQVTRYTLKDHKEGDPVSFDSLDAARNFLIAHRKTQLVRALDFVRFPGRMIGSMPNGPLRDSIEGELGYQRQFPLLTANGLRSRLKKEGLNLFKRGPKAITFVSSVYPRSRTAETVFADNIQKVVDFIERNPEIKITELPEKLLGIAPVAASPQVPPSEASSTNDTPVEAKPETVEAPAPVSAETPEAPKSDTPETGEAPVEEPVETTPVADAAVASEEALKAEEPVVAKPEPVAEKIEAAPKPTAKPAPAPEPAAAVDLSNPAVRELLNTVRWLVSEGYVTEYSDGCLFAMPVMTEAQIKEAAERAARRQPKRGNPASTDEHQEAEADMMQQEDVSDSDSGPV
jgi:hypothetical protein